VATIRTEDDGKPLPVDEDTPEKSTES